MGPRTASVLAVAGPGPWGPGFWRWRPRPRYSQRVPARAREKLGVGERGWTAEMRPIPIPSAPPRPPATPRVAALQSRRSFRSGDREEFSPKRIPLVPGAGRPARRPKQQPRSAPPARASHSPTRRCCASTAGAGTTTAARSGPRPGQPAPPTATPLRGPAPSPPASPYSAGVSLRVGLGDLGPFFCLWSSSCRVKH